MEFRIGSLNIANNIFDHQICNMAMASYRSVGITRSNDGSNHTSLCAMVRVGSGNIARSATMDIQVHRIHR